MFEYVRLRTLSDQTLTSAAVAGNEGVHDLKTIKSTSSILAYGLTHDLTVIAEAALASATSPSSASTASSMTRRPRREARLPGRLLSRHHYALLCGETATWPT